MTQLVALWFRSNIDQTQRPSAPTSLALMNYCSKRLLSFVLIGALGFVVDGGLLTLLSQLFDVNLYLSRLFSFLAATAVTWLLNRTWTFRVTESSVKRKTNEYSRYLLVQAGGALVNLGIFVGLVMIHTDFRRMPLVPLFVGALFGLLVNYKGSRYWVFPVAE